MRDMGRGHTTINVQPAPPVLRAVINSDQATGAQGRDRQRNTGDVGTAMTSGESLQQVGDTESVNCERAASVWADAASTPVAVYNRYSILITDGDDHQGQGPFVEPRSRHRAKKASAQSHVRAATAIITSTFQCSTGTRHAAAATTAAIEPRQSMTRSCDAHWYGRLYWSTICCSEKVYQEGCVLYGQY